ncbi:MAG: D-aminoacyl-tRNA deacylase [Vulcanimicrobiaceae bacterium]
MRAVVQRVSRAEVRVGSRRVGTIDAGLCVLLGVSVDDQILDATIIAQKVAGLRIFPDQDGLMNKSLHDTQGSVLLVSQFTLYGDARKGRRPSFIAAAKEELALPRYEWVGRTIEDTGSRVAYGEFGADMEVELVNDGPVTILLDSQRLF